MRVNEARMREQEWRFEVSRDIAQLPKRRRTSSATWG